MNWQHLIYFQKVAQTENFTQAAKELFITTPALSKAIRGIEEEVGFPLFEKRGRNSHLTESGRDFKACVEKAVNVLDTGLQEIYEKNGVVRGRLRLAGNWTMCGGYLPNRIKEYNHKHPEVTHFTRFLLTCDILRHVGDSSVHLGFCGDFSTEEYPDIERYHLFTEDLVLIVPPDHPLASREDVDFAELKDEAFISFKMITSGGAYESLLRLCNKYGFAPNVVYEMTDDHAIVSTVRIGLGIALVPCNRCLPLEGVRILPIRGEHPFRHQYMIWKKNAWLPPVASSFRDYVIEYEQGHLTVENLF